MESQLEVKSINFSYIHRKNALRAGMRLNLSTGVKAEPTLLHNTVLLPSKSPRLKRLPRSQATLMSLSASNKKFVVKFQNVVCRQTGLSGMCVCAMVQVVADLAGTKDLEH